jgi:hypothetical protein
MIPREAIPAAPEKAGADKARPVSLNVLVFSALTGILILFVSSCDHLSTGSIGSQPIKVTHVDEFRLKNAFDSGLAAFVAAENQRTLNPSVLEVLAASQPSIAAASQQNWEKAINVFKESIRELRKSKPDSVSAAARKLESTFPREEYQVNVLVLNTVTFYDSRQRNGLPLNTEDLKRDISSLHTQISPSLDPAIIRSDRMFE